MLAYDLGEMEMNRSELEKLCQNVSKLRFGDLAVDARQCSNDHNHSNRFTPSNSHREPASDN